MLGRSLVEMVYRAAPPHASGIADLFHLRYLSPFRTYSLLILTPQVLMALVFRYSRNKEALPNENFAPYSNDAECVVVGLLQMLKPKAEY